MGLAVKCSHCGGPEGQLSPYQYYHIIFLIGGHIILLSYQYYLIISSYQEVNQPATFVEKLILKVSWKGQFCIQGSHLSLFVKMVLF